MSRASKPVLLVGGIVGDSAEEVLRLVGPILGEDALGLTDGETGMRRMWVLFIAWNIWRTHPDVEMIERIERGVPGMPEYVPADYKDLPIFAVRDGIEQIEIDHLGYADAARSSYATFCKLRDDGVIPTGARFQVCLPFAEDPVRPFTSTGRDHSILITAYCDALKREVDQILEIIPPHDLVLQWDINIETVAVFCDDDMDFYRFNFKPLNANPLERFTGYIRDLCSGIPESIKLGLHLCYGDLGHKHMIEPADLEVGVRMANAARNIAGRRIDFVHMPVPRGRKDDAYFQPLENLELGADETLYIGLVHYTDGVDGSLERLAACKRHYGGTLGVATECGLGRRPPDQDMVTLFNLHKDVAAAI